MKLRAYLVDDEPLALERLRRLLEQTGRVEVTGSSTEPEQAVAALTADPPDVCFLDIQMPRLNGFDVLGKLPRQPIVIFTTAYDQYALDAFKANSIDYLLKPVEAKLLDRCLGKLERMLGGGEHGDMQVLLGQVRKMLYSREAEALTRVASRTGDRVKFIEVAHVTHFYAKDKLTFAVAAGKEHALDISIAELEQKLPQQQWVRIHRSTLLNVDAVKELRSWFGGKLLVKLTDGRTELQVARERAAEVRAKLGA